MGNTVDTKKHWLTPKATALAVPGVASSLLIGAGLQLNIDALKGIGSLLAVAYIGVLIWWLIRSRPRVDEIPDFDPIMKLFKSYWAMLGLIIIVTGLVLALALLVFHDGWWAVIISLLPAIVILVVLRRHFGRSTVISGIITFVALILVDSLLEPEMQSGMLLALIIAPQAMAGMLLLNHTRLTHSSLLDGDFLKALQSFGWGCLLAVPPSMLNIAMMRAAEISEFDRQFDHWGKAFYAFQPGILEEVWARLFLLTLFYALLRPTSRQKPGRALLAALVISVFIHGIAHFPQSISNLQAAILISLMYGIPLALIYIKRDLESAVAYHFLIDFVRFAFTVSLVS